MVSKSKILGSLTGFGLFLGVVSGAIAKPTDPPSSATHHQAAAQMGQFHRIEQPTGLKVGVALGGLALISLELWWFLWSKPKSQKAVSHKGEQELRIIGNGRYEPSRVMEVKSSNSSK